MENVVTSGDGSIEGLKLVRTEQKENSYSLRLENGTTSVQIDCDKFYVYTPHFSDNYLRHKNDMLILLDPSSLNVDNFYVKKLGKDQKNIEKKQSEGYLNELSVKGSQEGSKLIIDVNITGVKKSAPFFFKSIVGSALKDVLQGKTRVELPINDILFSGRALNKLQSLMGSNKTEMERNEMKPNTGLETVNTRPAEQEGTRTL